VKSLFWVANDKKKEEKDVDGGKAEEKEENEGKTMVNGRCSTTMRKQRKRKMKGKRKTLMIKNNDSSGSNLFS
jgi:hypothetical protein